MKKALSFRFKKSERFFSLSDLWLLFIYHLKKKPLLKMYRILTGGWIGADCCMRTWLQRERHHSHRSQCRLELSWQAWQHCPPLVSQTSLCSHCLDAHSSRVQNGRTGHGKYTNKDTTVFLEYSYLSCADWFVRKGFLKKKDF